MYASAGKPMWADWDSFLDQLEEQYKLFAICGKAKSNGTNLALLDTLPGVKRISVMACWSSAHCAESAAISLSRLSFRNCGACGVCIIGAQKADIDVYATPALVLAIGAGTPAEE